MDSVNRLHDPMLPVFNTSILNQNALALHGAARWHAQGFRGRGVHVAVLDTKIDPRLEFLYPAVSSPKNYDTTAPWENSILDSHGQRVSQLIRQFAPDATISVLPYSNPAITSGLRSTDVLEHSIRWAADNGCAILNASLTGSNRSAVIEAEEYAKARNVILVTSGGNDGISGFDVNNPIETQTTTKFGSRDNWISVANLNFTQDGEFSRASNSSVGPNLITSAIGRHHFIRATRGGSLMNASGTSYASPVIVGLLACYQGRYFERYGVYPTDAHLRAVIQANSRMEPYWDTEYMYDNGEKSYEYGYGVFKLPNNLQGA